MTSLDHVPSGSRWEFDRSVVDVFDDMLARSIPQYEVMRELTSTLVVDALTSGDRIVDLGASRGEAIARVLDRPHCPRITALAYECSAPMLEALSTRFMSDQRVVVIDRDLRAGLDLAASSVGAVLAVLTIQFVPIDYRQRIVAEVHRVLRPGGVFVLVEKVLGATSRMSDVFSITYRAMKSSNGYGRDEIERKAMALEGVLVPVTASWNEDTLRAAGFADYECVWRWCNFAAWAAYKAGA